MFYMVYNYIIGTTFRTIALVWLNELGKFNRNIVYCIFESYCCSYFLFNTNPLYTLNISRNNLKCNHWGETFQAGKIEHVPKFKSYSCNNSMLNEMEFTCQTFIANTDFSFQTLIYCKYWLSCIIAQPVCVFSHYVQTSKFSFWLVDISSYFQYIL